ncbi:uncharacterized protein N7484_000905 [Penicillium longicatenatum]|uniref:uncharacterized protein n=1 Tax=Penicillium longicatenatum TaxID=1561947 RepID=UPI00254843FB|nr:uncharacterized protein N7484_000905 [Penicillium longicatenatum]KAJ5657256.1 hypothetical protein N7484_000905 [Penicillium longicatenatum]
MEDKLMSHGLMTIRDVFSQLTWLKCLAVLIFSCIVTRVITGLRSQRNSDSTEARTPRVAPYWFPRFGHGPSFLWDHVGLLESLRDSMGEPVFGIYLQGKVHNTVVSPSMIKTVLSQKPSGMIVLDQAMRNVFGDRTMVRSLRSNRNEEIGGDVSAIISKESFITDTSKAITRLLQRNAPNLVTFSRSPVDQAPWERDSSVSLSEQDQSICEVNLFALVRDFVGHNITTLLLGEAFVESFPGTLQQFWTLDANFVSLFAGFKRWTPTPGISAGHAARYRLTHIMSVFYRAFTAWDNGIDPGIELRDLDDVSELFKQRMRIFNKMDLSPQASAAGMLSLHWDLMEYIVKMTFWNLVHIFADEELLKDIRKEMAPAVDSSRPNRRETGFPFDEPPKLNLDIEKMLQTCHLLKACHYETIRLHSAGISLRELESDLTLTESAGEAIEPRTYNIRKGEKVLMPHGVYQNDQTRFSNPDQYDPLRYLVTNRTTGSKEANPDILGPFAEGLYTPKNNAFTERAILAFTASIVSMWVISSADGKGLVVPPTRRAGALSCLRRMSRCMSKRRFKALFRS